MPFYQMVCIAAHYPEYKHIKELVTVAAKHVMGNGGVVRKIDAWGTMTLPHRMRRQKVTHNFGDYWTMNFDASPRTLKSLNGLMRQDPRVVRWTMLKLGDKVEDVVASKNQTLRDAATMRGGVYQHYT